MKNAITAAIVALALASGAVAAQAGSENGHLVQTGLKLSPSGFASGK